MEDNRELIKYFIRIVMPKLMFDEFELPNVNFYFKENDAFEYIKNMLIDYNRNDVLREILNPNYEKPIIEVSNCKLFFSYLNELLDSYNRLGKSKYNKEANFGYSSRIFSYIWLRMTPDDFKNPENFLKKSVEMYNNNIFDEYYEEKYFKSLNILDNNIVKIKNSLSNHYDEEPMTMLFHVLDPLNGTFSLPALRYGIYKKNEKLVCEIGSIQDIDKNVNKSSFKKIDRFKYKLNKDVPNDLKCNVEPKKLISLLIFIKLLSNKGINEIRIPSMYVLDYEFHVKANNVLRDIFESKWSEYNIERNIEEYNKKLHEFNRNIDKEEVIIANKSTNFINLFERLMYHIPNCEIIEYPMDSSSYFSFRINNLDNIRNEYVENILTKKKIQK